MNNTPESLAALKAHYRRLCQSLARTGYISQGSVQQRSVAASGRSGYQWTRKVAQKTVSVALSAEQFEAMREAVANERELWKIIQEMERFHAGSSLPPCPTPAVVSGSPRKYWALTNRHSGQFLILVYHSRLFLERRRPHWKSVCDSAAASGGTGEWTSRRHS